MDNIVDWLQNWTMSQIDGDWEHELGVSSRMLDNPGWLLSADKRNNELHIKIIEKYQHQCYFLTI